MFLVIPHRHYTFDKTRALTSLEHLLTDYREYKYEDDAIDIMDFIENVAEEARGSIDPVDICRKYLRRQFIDIHYHTFTESSFWEIAEWCQKNVSPWKSWRIVNRVQRQEFNEFYVEFCK